MNARASTGDNILITGIGGGVALLALQLCLARGANVYVSSGSEEKITRAITLGAKGGVNYKSGKLPSCLLSCTLTVYQHSRLACTIGEAAEEGQPAHALIERGHRFRRWRPYGQGQQDPEAWWTRGCIWHVRTSGANKLLRSPLLTALLIPRTAAPAVTFTMREVLKNQQLIGSTMGSHKDLIDATNFIAEHRLVPVVSDILNGLESAEEGFELINKGQQFGKVVIRIRHREATAGNARL